MPLEVEIFEATRWGGAKDLAVDLVAQDAAASWVCATTVEADAIAHPRFLKGRLVRDVDGVGCALSGRPDLWVQVWLGRFRSLPGMIRFRAATTHKDLWTNETRAEERKENLRFLKSLRFEGGLLQQLYEDSIRSYNAAVFGRQGKFWFVLNLYKYNIVRSSLSETKCETWNFTRRR